MRKSVACCASIVGDVWRCCLLDGKEERKEKRITRSVFSGHSCACVTYFVFIDDMMIV